jgi:hypothetical protein
MNNEIPHITWRRWLGIVTVSVLLGGCIHRHLTVGAYEGAVQVATAAQANFARTWTAIPVRGLEARLNVSDPAQLMLRYVGLQPDSVDSTVAENLANAFKSPDGTANAQALLVAARFLGPGQSIGDAIGGCEQSIVQTIAGAMARQLLGWPGDTREDLAQIVEFHELRSEPASQPPDDAVPVEDRVSDACAQFRQMRTPGVHLLGAAFSRTLPKSATDLADLILGPDACLPGGAVNKDYTECRLLTSLFSAALDADAVRTARLKINFLWGWERAAVAILAILILLALIWLNRSRKPLEKQARWLARELRNADALLSPNKPLASVAGPDEEARRIHRRFYERFGKSGTPQDKPYAWRGGLTVLRDLVDATEESLHADDRAHLEKFVELHVQALARQRAFINALITAFPAIGLVATLDGLILALSRASGIVAGTETERFASTELVTGVLSSSFSTTMLALIFMAVCMLINVREEHSEADLLEATHKRLIAVFWPGRTGDTIAHQ